MTTVSRRSTTATMEPRYVRVNQTYEIGIVTSFVFRSGCGCAPTTSLLFDLRWQDPIAPWIRLYVCGELLPLSLEHELYLTLER
jgi:hypothetical protein